MKRTILAALAILAVSAIAFAQSADIDKALLAAPGNTKAGATVIKWKADFTYDTLKKGTNKLVCYDRSGQPTQSAFSVECTSIENLPRVAQSLKIEAANPTDKKARDAAFEALEKAGMWTKPEFGSVWYHLRGADAEHTSTHMTIAVPGATEKTMGLPETGAKGGVWIMNAGTTAAHLMTPGE